MTGIAQRLPALAIFLVAATVAIPCLAQPVADDEKAVAKEHYDRGRAAYDRGQFGDAIGELKQAYMISRRPAILFNIAQTYRQLGDRNLALHYFRKFVAEAEFDDPNRPFAQSAVADLEREGGENPRSTPVPTGSNEDVEEDRGADVGISSLREFRHALVKAVPPGHPADVRIDVGGDAQRYQSWLYYRVEGQMTYTRVPFVGDRAGFVARIPEKEVSSGAASIQYYIETRAPEGVLYGSSGSAAVPNTIVVDRAAAPMVASGHRLSTDERERAVPPPATWTRIYRPAKWVALGAAALLGGVASVCAAKSASLSDDMQNRSRASSSRNGDGTWSAPQVTYGRDMEDTDRAGRRYNALGVWLGIGAGVVAVASGTLFYFDYRRSHVEASVAPVAFPGVGGVVGAVRF